MDGAIKATHEELCNQALKHYEELASEYSHWNSVVPKALEYYQDFGPEPYPPPCGSSCWWDLKHVRGCTYSGSRVRCKYYKYFADNDERNLRKWG